ncbi:hypothetical protein E3N88_03488 [Mikania micrantha]|uniref:Oleosin n=1 Tax=Mikania micrantha TaxID=192012 RepID=A0A5N6Q6V5_9ASTR|nr:hypothetical protein E3N88_03488 [Mikania micrantha]
MSDVYHQQQQLSEPRAHQVVKAATAATAGGSLLILSALTLTATVIALTVATPILVIFSPVLVPAAITVFLLATGFLTSGGFGMAAATVYGLVVLNLLHGHTGALYMALGISYRPVLMEKKQNHLNM